MHFCGVFLYSPLMTTSAVIFLRQIAVIFLRQIATNVVTILLIDRQVQTMYDVAKNVTYYIDLMRLTHCGLPTNCALKSLAQHAKL